MKIKNVLAITILSSVLFSPLSFAGGVAVEDAEAALMMDVLGESYDHQLKMKALRQQVELLEQKKAIANLMFDCKKKGVTCNPPEDNAFDMVIIDDNEEFNGFGEIVDEMSGLSVPEIDGLGGNLTGERLEVGDEGYDPRFDPESRMNNPAAAPQYPQAENEANGIQGDPSNDGATMEMPLSNAEIEDEVIVYMPMPPLLGIENDEAIFVVDSQEYRAKAGTYLPGDEWKVRDVSFDNVWMKGPDGKSKRVYINWR